MSFRPLIQDITRIDSGTFELLELGLQSNGELRVRPPPRPVQHAHPTPIPAPPFQTPLFFRRIKFMACSDIGYGELPSTVAYYVEYEWWQWPW